MVGWVRIHYGFPTLNGGTMFTAELHFLLTVGLLVLAGILIAWWRA